MTENGLSRRQLLATAGALFTAGCGTLSGSSDEEDWGTRFATRTGTTATATPTATTVPEDGAEINVDTPEPTTTRPGADGPAESTETPTERASTTRGTPSSVAERIERSRAALEAAVSAFGGSLTGVGMDSSFDPEPVRAEIARARSLVDVSEYAFDDEEARTVGELRSFATYLELLTDCQVAVNRAFDRLETVFAGLYDGEFEAASTTYGTYQTDVSEVADSIERLEGNTAGADVRAIESVTPAEYERKLAQLERARDGFEAFVGPVDRYSTGLEWFAEGTDSYLGRAWSDAEFECFKAGDSFGSMLVSFGSANPPGPLADRHSQMVSVSEALRGGAAELERSAQKAIEADPEERDRSLEQAIDAIRESRFARRNIEYVSEFLEDVDA